MNSLTLALVHAEELLNSRNYVIINVESPRKATMHWGSVHTDGERALMIATRNYYEKYDAVEYVTHTHY